MKHITVQGKSDIGLKRQENEDSFLAVSSDNYVLAVVADGMGGHRGGKDASLIAVDTIKAKISNDFGKQKPEQIIQDAFTKADKKIKEESVKKYGRQEMATTCSLVLAVKADITVEEGVIAEIYAGHVGDSRIYRVRDSGIERLSTDHTLMQSMMDSGAFEDGTADPDLPYGNLVYKSLGGNNLELDPVQRFMLKQNDSIILCSDGVTKYLEDDEILGIALKNIDNSSPIDDYIDIANERGGEDNITAVCLRGIATSDYAEPMPCVFPEEEDKFLCKIVVEKNAAIFAALFFVLLFLVSLTGAITG